MTPILKKFCFAAALLAAGTCHACEPWAETLTARPTLSLRVDNDMFGGVGQDRGYTNGFHLAWMSTNLNNFDDPICLPWIARGIDRYLRWLKPSGYEQKNVVLGLGQLLFTPSVPQATALLPNDRPYAAALLFSVGFNARSGENLRTSVLRLGMVGPSVRGEQLQNGWHKIIGVAPWRGWDNQLHDEPVFQIVHERMQRWGVEPERRDWNWDLISHWGGSLGNLLTYANGGAELRFGRNLPNDFGSDPLRPAGENTAPASRSVPGGWGWHLFLSVDMRAVAHNITLDGNTWRSSHRVDRRVFVGDFGTGVSLTAGRWKLALAHYQRTREFNGQQERPVFGSVTVSRRF